MDHRLVLSGSLIENVHIKKLTINGTVVMVTHQRVVDPRPPLGLERGLLRAGRSVVRLRGLTPQIGHAIGLHAQISTRCPWPPGSTLRTAAGAGWCKAEQCNARSGGSNDVEDAARQGAPGSRR